MIAKHIIIHKNCKFILMACTIGLLASFTASAEAVLLAPDAYMDIKEQCCLVDVRDAQAFLTERLPGSVWLASTAFDDDDSTATKKLAAPEALTAMLSERGFSQDMHIVLYGANSNAGDVIAVTHVFWVLEYLGYKKVSILDGGLSRWKAEDRATVSEPPDALPPATVTQNPDTANKRADIEQVKQAMASDNTVLVDARPRNQYNGAVPIRGLQRKGHIPGAYNIPYFLVTAMPHATFKSMEDLKEILYPEGITADSSLITYCNIGKSSSVLYFAYRHIGHEKIAHYDGGMVEWSANTTLPVSTDVPESN